MPRAHPGRVLVKRGMTILELCAVLAVIAILAAMSVPMYDVLVRRARADEARTVLHAIAHAEQRHFRDRGGYLACDSGDEIPRGGESFPSHRQCWQQLGIRLDGDVHYRYAVSLEEESFVVVAEGDLDENGLASRFTLSGRNLSLDIQDELE